MAIREEVLEHAALPHVAAHVSDTVLQPFLQTGFDAASYINAMLPSLAVSSKRPVSTTIPATTATLAELSSEMQTLLSQLNAQTTRLTTILTQLTDDIIRSGGRLAYEVDVLRGEALGLSETVGDQLTREFDLLNAQPQTESATEASVPRSEASNEPQHLSQLRMLTAVRERLDSVIKVFGEAMHWTIPPSEVSLASSFISVSAPDPGADSQSREQKGKDFADKIRAEVGDLVVSAEDPKIGFETAQARIDALKDLARLWKGTAEEKARTKFVDSLVKLAEDRLRDLERRDMGRSSRARSSTDRTASKSTGSNQSSGFLSNLYSLRQAS